MLKFLTQSVCFAFLLLWCSQAEAQLSLSTAVDLALKNSPKVKMAEADLVHARASLGVAKDAFIPYLATTGGYGRSTGAPLGVPVIFSISAQSLIYSFSQRDYIRSAGAGLQATEHALNEMKIEVAEDTTNTYLALNNALERRQTLQQTTDLATRLVQVTQDRLDAGVDTRMELTKVRITRTQLQLQSLNLEDEIKERSQHLASLIGLPTATIITDPRSIPKFEQPVQIGTTPGENAFSSEGVAAAYSIAKAKQLSAKGDRRYLFLPQITLQANYSRVDTGLSSYGDYYPRFAGTPTSPNSQNSLGFGASITIPLLDFTHRSHARESAADAAHALADAQQQEGIFREGRAKLQNSTRELDAQDELARLNQELAQDQLAAVRVQLEPGAAELSGSTATPKDELNAQLQERLKYLDVLKADLQLQQTRVNLLRQEGQLTDFVHRSLTGTPGASPAQPAVPDPAIPGTNPQVMPGSGVTGGSVPNAPTTPGKPVTPQLP